MGDEATASAVKAVKEFEEYLGPSGKSSDSSSVEDLRSYISLLIARGLNSSDRLLALARYVYLVKRNDLYLHLTTVLGGQGVYESIGERLEEIAGKAKRDEVFKGFILPPLGSQPEAYQKCTKELLDKLHVSLPPEKVREVLTGNHHRVPVEGFAEMKKRFEAAKSIDEFLVGEHQRLVEELEQTMKSGRLWYEQKITPEVLEFVKGDQTIQNGIREGDTIIKSKIPYDPDRWLKEKDPQMRRFNACHCQLARNAILEGTPRIPEVFCYCSAGYEKLPWTLSSARLFRSNS